MRPSEAYIHSPVFECSNIASRMSFSLGESFFFQTSKRSGTELLAGTNSGDEAAFFLVAAPFGLGYSVAAGAIRKGSRRTRVRHGVMIRAVCFLSGYALHEHPAIPLHPPPNIGRARRIALRASMPRQNGMSRRLTRRRGGLRLPVPGTAGVIGPAQRFLRISLHPGIATIAANQNVSRYGACSLQGHSVSTLPK